MTVQYTERVVDAHRDTHIEVLVVVGREGLLGRARCPAADVGQWREEAERGGNVTIQQKAGQVRSGQQQQQQTEPSTEP